MKNKFMRLASVMLVLTLLTTCGVSGTYAKYVTTASATDTARVAKFGVEISGGGNTFSKIYAADAEDVQVVGGATLVNSVGSDNNDNVVAPGTKGNFASFTITGKPEVAVAVSYEVKELKLEGWMNKDNGNYCPIIITVNGQDYNGLNYGKPADLAWTVKNAIEKETVNFPAQTNLEGQNYGLEVSWRWPFETGHDVEDTYLGDQAANGKASKITLEVACTVTQID